ncbi:MAG: hypothetical protein R3323_06600 [Wenzhouxiangellaceae bacterium]|nr:hypothetical protein [Wenzhouxiangellaceae bacterium]
MIKDTLTRLQVLLRREIWESPIAFKWTPVIIAGFILLFTVLALIIGMKVDNRMVFASDSIRMFAELDPEAKRLIVSGGLFSISAVFTQVMFIVLVFYLSGSLYDDRRDRSILFWKSLPVSDTLTVASKIVTACVIAPLLYMAGVALIQLLLLGIGTVLALIADVNPLTELWLAARLPRQWTLLVYAALVQGLWLLPIYAWLLFCSSWAPRLPILIAVIVPVLIGTFQHFWSLFSSFSLPEVNLLWIVLQRIGAGVTPTSVEWETISRDGNDSFRPSEETLMSFGSVTDHLFSVDMLVGLVIGLVFLVGAVWFRRRATDA